MDEAVEQPMGRIDDETRADRFRRRVDEAYDPESLSPAEYELVDEVCLTLDVLDSIRSALVGAPLTEQRQGGQRMNPLVTEARLQQAALGQLLRRFPGIADDDE